MPIEHKRTVKAYREDIDAPRKELLQDGSQQYNIRVADHMDISDYCCGLELSGCAFYYIPDTKEVLYILSRIRNPRYRDGHTPERDSVCTVWTTSEGDLWVRIGFASIRIWTPKMSQLTDSERSGWRDHYVEWIEGKLIEAETKCPA